MFFFQPLSINYNANIQQVKLITPKIECLMFNEMGNLLNICRYIVCFFDLFSITDKL